MLYKFRGYKPKISESSFIAGSADIIGNVTIEDDASIWFGAVLRGDVNSVRIGRGTNIQDNCTIHVHEDNSFVNVGEYVTVGHNVTLHGCKIGKFSLIGMGSIVLDGAEIGEQTMIGAGSLVTSNKVIPSGVLCVGSPAKVVRELTDEEKLSLRDSADNYIDLSKEYK